MNYTTIHPDNPFNEVAEAPVKLPVHLRTLFIGVRSRRRLLGAFAVGSLFLGLAGARLFGKKSFEARTVLLYRQLPSGSTLPAGEVDENDTPSLMTQMDMVKIDTNLEEVRRRLKLKETAEAIGRKIKVDVPINSSLMTITVTTDDAKKASDIANAARGVFLQQELGIQHAQAASRAADLVARQDKVMNELRTAEKNLKDFTIKNHVVDLDKEAGWYLQQLINTELVYEEAVGQNNASQLQQANIEKLAGVLERKVKAEEAQIDAGSPEQGASSSGAPDDDAIRGRVADLKMKQIEMDRSRTLADDGIYSKREYEKAKAAYEQERFLLYKDSPSASLYKEMTLRELDVQLAHISDGQKVAHLREAVDHVHERLDSLPLVQRDYLALSREVAIRAAEREHIDQLLGLARREDESQTFGFSVVSVATPSVLPLKSNRKTVFAALTAVGTLLGCMVALLLELFDRRLRCVGDARAKLHTKVLAGFQHGAIEQGDVTDEALTLVNRLRHMGVKAGSRLMIVSATPGEGAPELTRLLARAFATACDPTLLVDARFRQVDLVLPAERSLTGWRKKAHALLQHLKPELFFPTVKHSEPSLTAMAGSQSRPGLSDLLVNSDDPRDLKIQCGKDVRLLPAGQLARPELLLSHRMDAVLEANMHASEMLLVNTAPTRDCPDATFLAPCIGSAIMVAAAGKVTAEEIEKSIGLLIGSGISVLGVVVTNVAEAFAERRPA
jgi:uncharacterized protein involved in exopolysaccharide biosynthesis/Mrp family chromosome partitioning ATPase